MSDALIREFAAAAGKLIRKSLLASAIVLLLSPFVLFAGLRWLTEYNTRGWERQIDTWNATHCGYVLGRMKDSESFADQLRAQCRKWLADRK
jgi:hypothetical protein